MSTISFIQQKYITLDGRHIDLPWDEVGDREADINPSDRLNPFDDRTPPHFTVSPDLYRAITHDEMWDTVRALAECNLLKLPYPSLALTWDDSHRHDPNWLIPADPEVEKEYEANFPGDWLFTAIFSDEQLRYQEGVGLHLCMSPAIVATRPDGGSFIVDLSTAQTYWPSGRHHAGSDPHSSEWKVCEKHHRSEAGQALALLLVSLATKNTDQSVGYNKRAARGIGNGAFRSRDGAIIYRSATTIRPAKQFYDPTGRTMPIHWRCGHVHRWRKKDGSFVRKFLPPILVNAVHGPAPAKKPAYVVSA
jgi:hypothetical protein